MPEIKPYGINRLRETWVVKESVRRSMQSNTSTETGPERALRAAVYAAGLRGYRKNVRKLPGTPDIVFARAALAVFVHGCYWHRCPRCTCNVSPKTNEAFWSEKFARNVARDKKNRRELKKLGYRVLVLWECEVKRDAKKCVAKISSSLVGNN